MSQKSRVLIIDDEMEIRDTYEHLLSEEEYELYFAADGYQGLEKAEQYKPDLVVLDVIMPGMTGFEVCQRIRQTPLLAEIPILMITALDDHESTIKGIESGADDYIVKPFSRSEFCARIRTITRLNRYRRILNDQIRFQWVIQHADDGYLLVNGDDEITFSNSVAQGLLELYDNTDNPIRDSFTRKAKKIYQLKPPEAWHDWQTAFDESAERFLIRPETENSKPLWLKADVIKTDSQSPEYLICLKDITRNVIEKRISWNIQAQISHKIRTSLNELYGSLQFLIEVEDISVNEKKELLAAANRNALKIQNELLGILEDKNALQIFKKGQVPFNTEFFPELIKSVSSSLKIALGKLRYDNALSAKGVITLTYPALRIIFREILENSKKSHPSKTPLVEIRINRPCNGLIGIQIADDGVNLSPVKLTKIYTPFYQRERYITGKTACIGLGLAVVASIILESGGDFRAYHREDKPGNVIELKLPFKKTEADA